MVDMHCPGCDLLSAVWWAVSDHAKECPRWLLTAETGTQLELMVMDSTSFQPPTVW